MVTLRPALPALLIVVLVGLIVANACAPLYMPNAMHTSLPKKQGTVQGALYYGAGVYNGNIAVAPVDGLSLLGSFSYEPYQTSNGDSINGWSAFHAGHRFWDVGLGHTFMIDSTTLELLAGYGAGTARAYWPFDSTHPTGLYPDEEGVYRVDGDYQRIFLQMNGIRREKYDPTNGAYSKGGLALRASYLWFTRVDREDRSPIRPRAIFIDPVYFAVIGNRNIQAEMRMGLSIKVPLNDDQLRYSWIFVQLGVRGVLDGLW